MLRKLLANGVELHYLERGHGDPLVLVHGGAGDYRSWRWQLAPFSQRFRVVAYSRRHSYPNHNPPVAAGQPVFAEAGDLLALVTELQLERVHLVGHSYGALTALVATLQRPELVRSVVLAEPPLLGWLSHRPGGKAMLDRMAANVWAPAKQAFQRRDTRGALRIFTDGICGKGYFDRLSDRDRAARLRNAGAVRALLRSAGVFPALSREQVGRIAAPTLVVEGEHTSRIHRAVDDELLRCIPGAKRALIPAASHLTPRDNPAAFNRAVLRFLRAAPLAAATAGRR